MKDHFWKIVGLIALVAIIGSVVYSQQVKSKANEGVVIEDHVKGNPDASVVLVEYSDFQCPACAQFEPYVEDIMAKYGDQIRFEYRHFPLLNIHPNAVPAAQAAEAAAQQGKFWEMHDKLFANQTTWSTSPTPIRFFEQYAEEIGLDMDQFKLQLNSSVITNAIRDSFNEARGLGLSSTPSFFLNDEKMTYETFDDFNTAIEKALGVAPSGDTDAGTEVEFGI